jgi:WD40 repeat protein
LGLKNKQLLRTLRHNGTITKVNWAPDEKFIAACKFGEENYNLFAGGDEVYIWDIETFRLLKTFRGLKIDVSWSPNGKIMASYSQDGIVRIWDTKTWVRLNEYKFNNQFKTIYLNWTQDSKKLFLILDDGRILVKNILNKEIKQKRVPGNRFTSIGINKSPDGKLLALIRIIRVYTFLTQKLGQLFRY